MADGRLLLMVIHLVVEERTDRRWIEAIRIISARYAEPWERKEYEAGNSGNG
jgi:uncharacterized DUF497 family protein